MGYLDNAKEKAELAKRLSEQKAKEDPTWKLLMDKLNEPPPPEEQKVLDKLAKELAEQLKKSQGRS